MILAAGEAIGKMFSQRDAPWVILGVKIQLVTLVNSENLFAPLPSQLHSANKAVRPDVNTIRYYYKTSVVQSGFIINACNSADVGTKLNSLFFKTLALRLLLVKCSSIYGPSKQRAEVKV